MNNLLLAILIGALSVVIFDTLGSLAARKWNFTYSSLSIGSFLIYGIVGFLASSSASLLHAAAAGTVVGLIDATIGWRISWIIGPGQLPEDQRGPSHVLKAGFSVSMLAGFFGLCGGFLASL